MKRVQALTATFYKPDQVEQGIIDIAVVLDNGEMAITSILEGSPVNMVASILRDFADKIEKYENTTEISKKSGSQNEAPRTIKDSDRLDFLQKIMVDEGKYTGKCILRLSTSGRGYRLHETKWNGAGTSVRNEIDRLMMEKS